MKAAEAATARKWRSQRRGRIMMIQRATYLVHTAVGKGILPHVNTQSCVDCGLEAQTYDHRFYSRPLEVEPVCLSCNKRRGHAWDLEILCADMGEPL